MTSVPKELVSGCADKAALVAVARNYFSPDAVYPAPAPEIVKGEDWRYRFGLTARICLIKGLVDPSGSRCSNQCSLHSVIVAFTVQLSR